MALRSGRGSRAALAPLLVLLLFSGSTAAPFSAREAYRQARAAADRNDAGEALRLAEKALARAEADVRRARDEQPDDEWIAALRILRAEVLLRRGGNDRARGEEVLAAPLDPRHARSEAAVRRLVALGLTRDPAALQQADTLAAAHQPQLRYVTQFALASRAADLGEAERRLRAAMTMARRSGQEVAAANARAALAFQLARAERYGQAVEEGSAAVAAFRALHVPGRLATTSGNLGWAYLELGDYEQAAELFEHAERAASDAQLESERILWRNHRGNVAFAERRFDVAEQHYRVALARAAHHGDDATPAIQTNLARTALEGGRVDVARRAVDAALADINDATSDQRQSTLVVAARIDAAAGEYTRAEQTLLAVAREAKKAATRWAANASLAQLYARTRRNELAAAHYETAISDVRAVRDEIRGRSELRLSFFNAAEDLFDGYVDFLMRNGRVEEALVATELIRAATLEESLGVAAPRELDVRAAAGRADAVILCYWLGRERSYVWAVTPHGVAHAELPRDSIVTAETKRYADDLLSHRGTLAGSGERGEALYRMLVEPVERHVAAGANVVVIPDGSLHALNFETLVVPHPRRHYWISDVTIRNGTSLRLLAAAQRRPPSAEASLLLVGDPRPVEGFRRLPQAARELESVARPFEQRVVLTGSQATVGAYEEARPERFDYLHFVAHGVATRKRPLDSAVILSPDAANRYRLYARDIQERPLRARLVTISSCDGAGERTYAGEGLVGVAWAFLRAGAGQVIAALWEANDGATPELMDAMYSRIAAGDPPPVALREAKLTLVNGKGIYATPKFWATFVLYSRE